MGHRTFYYHSTRRQAYGYNIEHCVLLGTPASIATLLIRCNAAFRPYVGVGAGDMT